MRHVACILILLAACGGDESTPPTTTSSDATDEVAVDVVLPDATGLPETAIENQPLAGICQNDGQCTTGLCNTFPTGGYCTQRCDTNEECGTNAKCVSDFVSDGVKEKICLKTCTVQTQCRNDQFCPTDAKICIARCQPGECQEGYECDLVFGRCEPAPPCQPVAEIEDGLDQDCNTYIDEGFGPPIARPPHVVVHDYGKVRLGGSGVSRSFAFFADEGTSSFTIVVMNLDNPTGYLQLYALSSPDGRDLMGSGDPYAAPNRAFPSFSAYTVQVPNTDAFDVEPGRYGFSIYSFPGDNGEPPPVADGWVYIVENRRVGATTSTLDVNYWFVGLPGIDSAKAQTDPRFQQLLTRFEGILGNAGISVGERRFLDVTGDDAQRFTIVDTSDDFDIDEHAELLAQTRSLDPSNTGVSFFFVQGFTGWDLLGKAGGIPGPPMLHGTFNSGVVVSLADYINWTEEPAIALELTAETMAHELGHQLGLYHVTEGSGDRFDHVLDTPECPRVPNDKNGDGAMDPLECAVKGATNLMFWAASLESGLSPGQRKVLHKNPTLRD